MGQYNDYNDNGNGLISPFGLGVGKLCVMGLKFSRVSDLPSNKRLMVDVC